MAKHRGLSFYKKEKKITNEKLALFMSWLFMVFLGTLLAYFFVYTLGIKTTVIGTSMEPSLYNGQVVFLNRVVYNLVAPKRGDVVAFLPNGNANAHISVKRVVGVPGDRIEIKDGILYLNNEPQSDMFDDMISDPGIAADEILLSEDEFFLMGDNCNSSERAMEEDIRIIDLVLELVDARAPLSSRNPVIDALAKGKGRMILLNKADLADERATKEWTEYFESNGITAVALDSRSRKGLRLIDEGVKTACREKIERNKKKGIINRPMRAMVVGIPNVGKSTFINSYAGKAVAKTGNKPGVTRGKQWVRLGKNLELLDTPGILWPKIDDDTAGFHLAVLGSMNDLVIDREELIRRFLKEINAINPQILYNIYEITGEMSPDEMLRQAAKSRNALKKGGMPDTDKAVSIILNDFRSGKMGRITLDNVPRAVSAD